MVVIAVLARLRRGGASTIDELQRCAQQVGGLPTDHAASIIDTLQISILALTHPTSMSILRLAAAWSVARPMPDEMLEAVLGAAAADGAGELEACSLATKSGASSLAVHALVSGVTAWLLENGSLTPSPAEPDDHALRSAAASWLRSHADDDDVWTAATHGETALHLLDPVRDSRTRRRFSNLRPAA